MRTVTLIAAKLTRYGKRRLRPGDQFEAARSDMRVLVAAGLATEPARGTYATKVMHAQPVALTREAFEVAPTADGWRQYEPGEAQAIDDLDALRSEYETRTGRKADKRWGAARLAAEIEDAR